LIDVAGVDEIGADHALAGRFRTLATWSVLKALE